MLSLCNKHNINMLQHFCCFVFRLFQDLQWDKMRLRNAAAASSQEDVAGRNIPVLTGALSCVNLTRMHSGFFLPVKPEHIKINDTITTISTQPPTLQDAVI